MREKLMIHVLRKFRSAILISNARTQASLNKFDSALSILLKIFSLYGCGGPTNETPLLANIFFADLCERQGNKEASYQACEIAIGQLNSGIYGDAMLYSKENNNYLKYKCKWILSRLSNFSDSLVFQKIKSINVNYDSINIENVAPFIRRLFPIDSRYGYQIDEYISKNSGGGVR